MLANADPAGPPPPPAALIAGASLLLDFDGTLVELIDRPDAVIVDEALGALLDGLARALPARIAIVSGRSVAQLEALLGARAAGLALAGSHGLEDRWPGAAPAAAPSAALATVAEALRAFAGDHAGALVESKSHGAALHYRRAPDIEGAARALADRLGAEHGLVVQPGKMMIELRTGGGDKGDAVRRLMARAEMAGTRPLFLGDDLTDEPAFAVARELGGAGILVGPARETAAAYRLADVAAVHRWLGGAAR